MTNFKFRQLLFSISLLPFLTFAQEHDPVLEQLDSLTRLYYFQKLEFEPNNSNFKPNEIPQYPEQTFVNRINELNKHSPFKFVYNAQVRKYINGYINNPKSAAVILTNSRFYFPMIEKHLVHNKIPLELKFLSVVESGMNPTAKSGCGAAGLWQFMYGTGSSYRLMINSYIDERYDPEKETIAACHYLKDLYAIYKDWSLVIAAYNCGPGTINKAIKLSGGKRDFWTISAFLPKESQVYVPAFIAATYALSYYKEHNLNYAKTELNPAYLDYLIINKKSNLKNLAKKFKMSYETLKYLNPKFYTEVVPGNNDYLIVPHNIALSVLTPVENEKEMLADNKKINSKKNHPSQKTESTSNDIQLITNASDPNRDFVQITDSALTVYAEALGQQELTDSALVTFHTTKEVMLKGQVIPINSLMYGKAYFQPKSIYLKIEEISYGKQKLRLHLESEILEQPINGKFTINDDYLEIFKM